MRLFIAIELPEDVRQAIAKVQQQLQTSGADANWTRPEGIHLTLKFLGDVPEAKVAGVLQGMTDAAQGTGTLRFEVSGAGAFPSAKAPRVLWLGLTGDTARLAALQRAVEDAMAAAGFEREERNFSPHLTLARIRFPRPRDNWERRIEGIRDVRLGGFDADRVSLMKSELHPGGAVYTEVGGVDLE
jgi:RNA 2',3'-cyclic 3'-phosphodiesterase